MKQMAADGVRAQTCVTSPPYWQLRDYGVAGQIGLEPTLREWVDTMVDVFRCVRDVLADDGTMWVNLGDSYAQGGNSGHQTGDSFHGHNKREGDRTRIPKKAPPGFKAKDLLGQPWRLALALQEPYYTGRIKNEIDRVWLAAMIDGEGCIFIHRRKAGQPNGKGYFRKNDIFASGLEVANTSRAIVEKCMRIAGVGSICSQGPDETGGRRKQELFRWNVRSNECLSILREVYPYLVAKQHQARLACGCDPSGERATAFHKALIGLHRGHATSVDTDAPRSMFEQGFFLRSDIIWKKPNPMPESVTDRPTKSHEYMFLLAKNEKYYYDQAAIREPCSPNTHARMGRGFAGYAPPGQTAHTGIMGPRAPGVNPKAASKPPSGWDTGDGDHRDKTGRYDNDHGADQSARMGRGAGWRTKQNESFATATAGAVDDRNKRSVWTIPTEGFEGAHFATFPRALIEPCILAGAPAGGIVLDPFMGSGTTAQVATDLGRQFIGCELNAEYVALHDQRRTTQGMQF